MTTEELNNLEAPLVGLLRKPLEEYTDEELRDFVQRTRTLRDSRQTFKAAVMSAQSEPKETKEKVAKAIATFADF